jgi:c-di-GMP-binding flagellar brake protein YcgR
MWRGIILAQSEPFDVRVLQFRESTLGLSNDDLLRGLTALAFAMFAGLAYYLIRQRRQSRLRRRTHMGERLRLALRDLNLGAAELELLQQVTGSDDPARAMALVEGRDEFEAQVKAFREREPGHPALGKLGMLRQRLGFGFGNLRVPFTTTRMLAPGQRLQCRIAHPKREISFVTVIVGSGETRFWVRPPYAKGQPVSLERFGELGFRVARENDAEYEFTCRVAGQAPSAMRPVALEHTESIRRMFFRNAPRIPVELPMEFYVVRKDGTEKSAAQLRARDAQYTVKAELRDLSVGGALVFARQDGGTPRDGDTLIFQLPAAQIRDDLVAEVVRTVPRADAQRQLHLQFVGLKELDRLKLNKYLTNLTAAGVAASRGEEKPG